MQDAAMNEFEVVRYPRINHPNIFGINITYRNYHLHNDLELFFVLGGNGLMRLANTAIPMRAGSLTVLNVNEPHAIDAGAGSVDTLVFQLSAAFLRDYLPSLNNRQFPCGDITQYMPACRANTIEKLLLNTAGAYFEQRENYDCVCFEGLIHALRLLCVYSSAAHIEDHAVSRRTRSVERMNRIVAYIDEHYADRLTLTELAEMEGVNTEHLSHFISKSFGVTFTEYLNNIRYEKAMELLPDRSLSLLAIAERCGFSDIRYMNRSVYKHFGRTPQQYRQELPAQEQPYARPNSGRALQRYYEEDESLRLLENYARSRGIILGAEL